MCAVSVLELRRHADRSEGGAPGNIDRARLACHGGCHSGMAHA